jgi:hypothetical protein
MNEIEKAAREWWSEIGYMQTPTDCDLDLVDVYNGFKAGYNHAQSMASDGFEAFIKSKLAIAPTPEDYENLVNFKEIIELGWAQAKLSCAKIKNERIKELEEKLAISSQIMDAMTKTSQNNYKLTQQVKDIEQQLYQSNKERAELEQKLAIAVEALGLISLDNIYVGENGWRDEHFLNVKQAKEALTKINQK